MRLISDGFTAELEKTKKAYIIVVVNISFRTGIISINACQSALQPWVSLGLLYNQSPPGVRFLNKIIFYRMGLLAPCQFH
jgi:hypothetical protein